MDYFSLNFYSNSVCGILLLFMLFAWLNHCNRYSSKSVSVNFHFYFYPFFLAQYFLYMEKQHILCNIYFLRSSTSCSLKQNHCCLFFMPVLNMLAAMLHSILMYHGTHWEHTLETNSYEQIMHRVVTCHHFMNLD
jgi:hypothetical protein